MELIRESQVDTYSIETCITDGGCSQLCVTDHGCNLFVPCHNNCWLNIG